MANKIYDPRTKSGGVHKKGINFSHPNYNYLGHFKKPEVIRAGHKEPMKLGGLGLHHEEMARHMQMKQEEK